MPSPNKNEQKTDHSSGTIYTYEDPKTGELYQYRRRCGYKKNGRTLVFLRQSKGESIKDEHILNKAAKIHKEKTEE